MRTHARRGIAAGVLVLILRAPRAARADEVGAVAEIGGQAEVQHAGATDWVALKPGDPVELGDQVRTAADSKLKLLFHDDSVLTLAPGSLLKIDESIAGTGA